jgi:tetratricopeptide (TPR) repeat protein
MNARVDDFPLVSVVVRSMGRPELADTLASIAAQEYPRIEVIVVDATGGGHPPLPEIAWPPGHVVRKVGGDRRLPRPMACNVGLDAVQGEWFAFLDDDDTYLPGHVTTLMQAARSRSYAIVAYAKAERVDAEGRVMDTMGSPFIRAMYYHGVLFLWQAAIIATRARDLGCRFDEAMDICEDLDFMMQVSAHGEFVYLPQVILRFRQDTGTSGTGRGRNWDGARTLYYRGLLHAKWIGIAERHRAEQMARLSTGLIAYYRGDVARATAQVEAARQAHPDDTYVLAMLARLRLDTGAVESALELVERAVEDNPNEPEFRALALLILDRMGRVAELRQHARVLLGYPHYHKFAREALARLPSEAEPDGTTADDEPLDAPEFGADSVDPREAIERAVSMHRHGAGLSATRSLADIDPTQVRTPGAAMAAADIAEDLAEYELALGFLRQAMRLARHGAVIQRFRDCAANLFLARALDSLRDQARDLHARLLAASGRSRATPGGPLHVVGDFRPAASGDSRAMRLYNALSGQSRVIPWALMPLDDTRGALPGARVLDLRTGAIPAGGSVAIVGALPFASTWIAGLEGVSRVIIDVDAVSEEDMKALITLLVQCSRFDPVPEVRLVYASEYLRERVGLPGDVVVTPPGLSHVPAPMERAEAGKGVVSGRLCLDQPGSLHPEETNLARHVVAAGNGYALMDGTPMARFFQGMAWPSGMVLYAPNAMPATGFLDGLDIYLCWPHPRYPARHIDDLLLAMASGLPAIIIGSGNALAELVEHEVTGYLVTSEEEALGCIEILASDRGLRLAMGLAARERAVALNHGLVERAVRACLA